MIVMKFGGSSIADAAGVRRAVGILRTQASERLVAVVSAHGRTTDLLEIQSRRALHGTHCVRELRQFHHQLVEDLGIPVPAHGPLFEELEGVLQRVAAERKLSHESRDLVLSFGERLSSHTVAAALRDRGLEAAALMAYDAGLTTDSRFGQARPLLQSDRGIRECLSGFPGIPVVTGFLGKDRAGRITTVGRNGSDFTAAVFARAMDAREIQIWTDVPGVMSADPRIVPAAQPLRRIPGVVAAELAHYGAQVLHPSTLEPAKDADIPIRVLHTLDPDEPGTVIDFSMSPEPGVVQAIVQQRARVLLHVGAPYLVPLEEVVARLSELCGDHHVNFDMTTVSEISATLAASDGNGHASDVESVVAQLREFADVSVRRDVAAVAVVGQRLGDDPAVVGKMFRVLTDQEISLHRISMGSDRSHIGLVVDESQVEVAVRALHAALLEKRTRPLARATSA